VKTSTIYLVYVAVGVVTGISTSLVVCGACTAAVGGWFGPDDRTGVSFFASVAEVAAPLIGMADLRALRTSVCVHRSIKRPILAPRERHRQGTGVELF
jgi:hypothetical protein